MRRDSRCDSRCAALFHPELTLNLGVRTKNGERSSDAQPAPKEAGRNHQRLRQKAVLEHPTSPCHQMLYRGRGISDPRSTKSFHFSRQWLTLQTMLSRTLAC